VEAAGSSPALEPEILTAENTGRVSYQAYDERVHRSDSGPQWLSDPRAAGMVAEAVQYGVGNGLYDLSWRTWRTIL